MRRCTIPALTGFASKIAARSPDVKRRALHKTAQDGERAARAARLLALFLGASSRSPRAVSRDMMNFRFMNNAAYMLHIYRFLEGILKRMIYVDDI